MVILPLNINKVRGNCLVGNISIRFARLSPVGDTNQRGRARQNQERLMLCDICGRDLELGHTIEKIAFFRIYPTVVFLYQ